MTTTTLLLMRHGETDANRLGVYQGHRGVGLNERGRDQARRLAERLHRAEVRLDALYASDLQRAFETAQAVGARLGIAPIPDSGLREINVGAWAGLSNREVAERFPDEWAAWRRGEDVRRTGGENYADLQARLTAALDRLARAHPGGTLGIVSHGAAIKLFVAAVLGIGMDRLRFFHVVANTSVSVVTRTDDGPWDLVIWNDARHLPDDPLAGIVLEDA